MALQAICASAAGADARCSNGSCRSIFCV